MKQFETSIEITVYSDESYHYVVQSGKTISITYSETSNKTTVELSFGSIDELEAVALAMLKVVKMSKE